MALSCQAYRRRPSISSKRLVLDLLLVTGALSGALGCSPMQPQRSREVFERELNKAETGDRLAAFRVAGMFLRGVGTPRDVAKAVYWYEIAGPRDGWAMLGLMYEQGADVPKDLERAASYYRRATDTGEPVAMYQLGALHAKRQIRAADPVEGYMWLRLAEITGRARGACAIVYECTEWAIKDRPGHRRELGSQLTPAQKNEAERQTTAWLEAHPSVRR